MPGRNFLSSQQRFILSTIYDHWMSDFCNLYYTLLQCYSLESCSVCHVFQHVCATTAITYNDNLPDTAVCLSVQMIQPENCQTDFDDILNGRCATGFYLKTIFISYKPYYQYGGRENLCDEINTSATIIGLYSDDQ